MIKSQYTPPSSLTPAQIEQLEGFARALRAAAANLERSADVLGRQAAKPCGRPAHRPAAPSLN